MGFHLGYPIDSIAFDTNKPTLQRVLALLNRAPHLRGANQRVPSRNKSSAAALDTHGQVVSTICTSRSWRRRGNKDFLRKQLWPPPNESLRNRSLKKNRKSPDLPPLHLQPRAAGLQEGHLIDRSAKGREDYNLTDRQLAHPLFGDGCGSWVQQIWCYPPEFYLTHQCDQPKSTSAKDQCKDCLPPCGPAALTYLAIKINNTHRCDSFQTHRMGLFWEPLNKKKCMKNQLQKPSHPLFKDVFFVFYKYQNKPIYFHRPLSSPHLPVALRNNPSNHLSWSPRISCPSRSIACSPPSPGALGVENKKMAKTGWDHESSVFLLPTKYF